MTRDRFSNYAWRTMDKSSSASIVASRSQADATERAGQKIVLQRQLTDLGMQRFDIGAVSRFSVGGKYLRRPLQVFVFHWVISQETRPMNV